jgi:hypothetical protein
MPAAKTAKSDKPAKAPAKKAPAKKAAAKKAPAKKTAKAGGVTLQIEMPAPIVEVMKQHNLKISLNKVAISKLADQERMKSAASGGNGCISNVGGPSC